MFFNLGDCGTLNNTHHGTPKQRMAAAGWAYNVAKNAERQGKVLPSKVFIEMFDAALTSILAN